jgi:hypothetical protein
MSRKKKEYSTCSKENYNRFIRENGITEKELSYKKYVKNLKVCNWMFIEYALRTGLKINLPHGFGPLTVNKKKLKLFKEHDGKKYINLRVDWSKTKKLGKRVYHTNEHSDGYNFRWLWFPGEAKLHLSDLYIFKPGRYASRAINRYIKKSPEYKELYLEWMKPYFDIENLST